MSTPVSLLGNSLIKVILVLSTEHYAMKAYWRSGSIAPLIL
jgi:hypothetical protein